MADYKSATTGRRGVVRGEVAIKTEDIELPLYFPIIFTEYNYIVNMFIEAYTSLNNMTNYTTHT